MVDGCLFVYVCTVVYVGIEFFCMACGVLFLDPNVIFKQFSSSILHIFFFVRSIFLGISRPLHRLCIVQHLYLSVLFEIINKVQPTNFCVRYYVQLLAVKYFEAKLSALWSRSFYMEWKKSHM